MIDTLKSGTHRLAINVRLVGEVDVVDGERAVPLGDRSPLDAPAR
nr:hypothetical protein [Sphingomonas liriopis]